MLAASCEAAEGQIFNCGDDVQYTLAQWVEIIGALLGASLEIIDVPTALRWTVRHFLTHSGTSADMATVDITKARELLGYRDVVAPIDELRRELEWLAEDPVDWTKASNFTDTFDYQLEDDVRDGLAALAAALPEPPCAAQPVHSYAHPRSTSLSADGRGR
jgi:hypothetical protein